MTDQSDASRASGRRPRRRAGLGKGLGALIPTTEEEQVPDTDSRPLDVLFPDLVGNGNGRDSRARAGRGGPARDLLSPGRKAKIVSRETISSEDAQATATDRHQDAVALEDRNAVVLELQADTTPDSAADDPAPIVSRETISTTPRSSIDGEGSDSSELTGVPGATFAQIDPTWIIPNLKQPREVFDPDELQELSRSIEEVGVLQPIVVRRITSETLEEEGQADRLRVALRDNPEARYELVMGERRWRASQAAGLDAIPAIVRTTDEDELLREALIENMHRVQLNPLEEAAAYTQLMEDFGYTQEELSRKIAKSRPQIANTLRLMNLPPSVQRQVAAGVLSAGHARALLRLDSAADMEALAARIVAEGLSVRATEEIAKFGMRQGPRTQRRSREVPAEIQRVAEAVAGMLDTSVSVSAGAKKGRLVIEFADQADLDRIANLLGIGEEAQERGPFL